MPDLAPTPGGQPPQPPFGSSPATGPTLNKGYEAAAAQKVGLIGKQVLEALNLVGPSSEIGQVLVKVLGMISKIASAGATTPAVERNNIESMAMKNAQQNQMLQQLKQQGGMGGGPPKPGGMPGAPPPGGGGMPPPGGMPGGM